LALLRKKEINKKKNVKTSSWGLLEVETFPDFEPEIQAYAAGLVEGRLTQFQIYTHYQNTVRTNYTNKIKLLFY
jgi:hypothetical protein